jgi:hypothetical protein
MELYYLRARWYEPQVGRWNSPDTIIPNFENPQSLNRYAYVLGNPVNLVDPTGYQGGPIAGTGSGGIMYCFGIALLVPEPFLELGCGFLVAMGLIAATPAIGTVVQEGESIQDTFHPFPTAPQLDPLPPFELGSYPDPLGYNPGPRLDAGLEQTLTLPGFPADQPEPTTRIYDFPLVQPCLEDSILLSSKLARALEKAGIPRPPNTAAHHIVAENAMRAEEARRILRHFGVDINAAANGVYLPVEQEGTTSGLYHPSLHSNAYYTEVNDRLRGATSENEVLEILDDIRGELLNGTFPYK